MRSIKASGISLCTPRVIYFEFSNIISTLKREKPHRKHLLSVGPFRFLSTALWTNCTIIDLSCISAVHPLAAAVAKGCVLRGAGMAQPVTAELDYLPAQPASPAADAEKVLFRRDSPFFSLYIDNTSTEIRLSRYCTTAVCGPAYSRDSSCGSGWAAGRPASQKWR